MEKVDVMKALAIVCSICVAGQATRRFAAAFVMPVVQTQATSLRLASTAGSADANLMVPFFMYETVQQEAQSAAREAQSAAREAASDMQKLTERLIKEQLNLQASLQAE